MTSVARLGGGLRAGLLALSLLLGGGSRTEAQITAAIDTAALKAGGIEGFVVNALTGKPMEGAAVEVIGTSWRSLSGSDGAFRLRSLFPGTCALKITAEGMRPVCVADVAVPPGRTVRLRPIDLRPLALDGIEPLAPLYVNASQLANEAGDYALALVPMARLIVVPSHYAMIEEAVASSSDLSRQDLEILPQKGEDLYRAIAHLPGLATSDTATRFWVRGAPNDQVLTRFDGVDLLEPFHVKGFDGALSVVDLETVSRLDLITGGFTAKYGDRMAGVLTMETETFDPAKPRYTLGGSLTNARTVARGEFDAGRGNWMVESRAGYPGRFVGDAGQDTGEMKTRYFDFSVKIEYRLTPDQDVSFHLLRSRDQLRFTDAQTPDLASDYGSDYLWGRWRGKFGEQVYGETVLSLGYLTWRHREIGVLGNAYEVSLKDNRFLTTAALRQDWTVVLSHRALVQGGVEYSWGQSEYRYFLKRDEAVFISSMDVSVPGHFLLNRQRGVTGQTGGVYLAPRIRLTSRLTIEPSVRVDDHDYTRDTDLSPRFNASYALGRTTLRAAWGIYYQSEGLHQLGIGDNDDAFHPAERAEHRVLSVEHRLVSGIQLRAEVYERRLSRLRPHWENLVNVDEAFPEMKYDRVALNPSSAWARGLELTAENRTPGRFNWAASYALAATRETVNGQDLPRPRDQRHTFAIDLSYAPTAKWRISTSWQYHTGWPTTEVHFFSVPYLSGPPAVFAELGPWYAQRLPSYHRLDLRVTRLVYFKGSTLRIFADLFNAYNRKNIQGYMYSPVLAANGTVTTIKTAQTQISLTPNLGAVWEF